VLCSTASLLVTNDEPDDAIRSAIERERLEQPIVIALSAALDEMAPANPAALVGAITRFCALVGQDWSDTRRAEFIEQVAIEFEDAPGSLVLDALHRARRRVSIGRELVRWIWEDIEPRVPALRHRVDLFTRLGSLIA
jgi:hypothetical protein